MITVTDVVEIGAIITLVLLALSVCWSLFAISIVGAIVLFRRFGGDWLVERAFPTKEHRR